MTEPVKVLPMAKLLRLAREKEEREREASAGAPEAPPSEPTAAQKDSAPGEAIASQTIVRETIPNPTIVSETIVGQSKGKSVDASARAKTKKSPTEPPEETGVGPEAFPAGLLDVSKGYYPSYNDLSDRLIPELGLNPFEQSVLQRLYRLSRGWKSDECEVGLGTLAKFCVMSRSQVQRSVTTLIEKGLVVNLGPAKKGSRDGNRYKVLPGVSTIPPQTIVSGTIVPQETTIVPQTTVVCGTIVPQTTNKNINKDILKTHTHTEPGVRVGSKFSLEECRAYAESLRPQGIQNPGGYATTIHRSGEADEQVDLFLRQRRAGAEKPSLSAEQIQEQVNAVVPMLQQGSSIEEVEQLLAANFRRGDWLKIRSMALAQAKVSPPPAG